MDAHVSVHLDHERDEELSVTARVKCKANRLACTDVQVVAVYVSSTQFVQRLNQQISFVGK